MRYQEVQNGYLLRLEKEEELIHTLQAFVSEHDLPSCTIQGIGSIKNPTLAYYDLDSKKFTEKEFEGAFELLSCVGSIGFETEKPLVHLHATLSDEHFRVIGGHVVALPVHATVELSLFSLDQKLTKSYNNEIGLKLYDLQCDFQS